jgi:hypothetical protein
VTVDDLIAFLNAFQNQSEFPSAAAHRIADLVSEGGTHTSPDGRVTADDLIAFVASFSEGC